MNEEASDSIRTSWIGSWSWQHIGNKPKGSKKSNLKFHVRLWFEIVLDAGSLRVESSIMLWLHYNMEAGIVIYEQISVWDSVKSITFFHRLLDKYSTIFLWSCRCHSPSDFNFLVRSSIILFTWHKRTLYPYHAKFRMEGGCVRSFCDGHWWAN